MENLYLLCIEMINFIVAFFIKLLPIIAIFSPCIASLLVLSCGRYISCLNNILFIVINMFISLLAIVYLFINIAMNKFVLYCFLYNWLVIDLLKVSITLYYDALGITMLLLIVCISFLVHIYSIYYMKNDPYIITFLAYLSIFTFFMFFLVISNNFVMFFFGWEGVGLCSYLLINFWSDRVQANKSALKAMLVNRIGDIILLIVIALIFSCFGSLDFQHIFMMLYLFKLQNMTMVYPFIFDVIAILLFFGSLAKSAQLGLHSWLPDAMEGPTPVSALIHAATMVTAGVFLLIRCSYLLECSWYVKPIIIFFGSLTCLFAGLVGSFQVDIKKIIAYSTMGQLGYMYIACGASCYQEAFFHLWIHGFIKAMLFLGAGIIIHNVNDEQNIFRLGGLINFFPLLFYFLFFASTSLMSLPYLSGYFSKHVILELVYNNHYFGYFGYLVGSCAAFFTAFYSVKLLLFVFCGPYNGAITLVRSLIKYEWSFFSYGPLFLLVSASICLGSFFYSIFTDIGSDFFNYNISLFFDNNFKIESENLSCYYTYFPLCCTLFGCFFAVLYFLMICRYGNYMLTILNIKRNIRGNILYILLVLTRIKNFFFLLTHSFFAVILFYPYKSWVMHAFLLICSPLLYVLFLGKLLLKVFYITFFYIFGGLFDLFFFLYNMFYYYYYSFICFLFKNPTFVYKRYRSRLLLFLCLYDVFDIFYFLHVIFLLIRYDFFLFFIYLLMKYRVFFEKFINVLPNEMRFIFKIVLYNIINIILYYRDSNKDISHNPFLFYLHGNVINKIDTYSFIRYTGFHNLSFVFIYNNLRLRGVSYYFFLVQFFHRSMFFDKIVNNFLSLPFFRFLWDTFFKTFDKGLFELLGPLGCSRLIHRISLYFLNLQSGWLFDYICSMILGVLVLTCLCYLFI